MRRCRLIVCVFFVGTLAIPRTADAGLVDIIWEMSGPQMFGVGLGLECRFGGADSGNASQSQTQTVSKNCEATVRRRQSATVQNPLFAAFAVGGAAYFSTGKNPRDERLQNLDFLAWKSWMFEGELMLIGGIQQGQWRLYGAGGLMANYMIPDQAANFWAAGIKVRPGLEYRFLEAKEIPLIPWTLTGIGVEYTWRFYPISFDTVAVPGAMPDPNGKMRATVVKGSDRETVRALFGIVLKFG